jgi:hypothetical protein
MTDAGTTKSASTDTRPAGLDDVIRTAGEVADRLRDAAAAVVRLGEREIAMVLNTLEDIRDRTVASERLESARRMETIAEWRRTTHRGIDLGFDAVAVTADVGADFLDAALRRPKAAPASQP